MFVAKTQQMRYFRGARSLRPWRAVATECGWPDTKLCPEKNARGDLHRGVSPCRPGLKGRSKRTAIVCWQTGTIPTLSQLAVEGIIGESVAFPDLHPPK